MWAARFYKTRNLAASNIKKGLVHLSGKTTTKPASILNKGSQLVIKNDLVIQTILVEEIAVKRVSYEKAKQFYKVISKDNRETATFFRPELNINLTKK